MAEKDLIDRALYARIQGLELENAQLKAARKEYTDLLGLKINPTSAGLGKIFTRKNPYYSKGDEDAPFFTEAYLYTLLGKEDARTVLAYVRGLGVALGYSREDLP